MGHSGPIIGILYDGEGKPFAVHQMLAKLQPVDPGQAVPRSLDFPFTAAEVGQYEVYLPGQVA